MRTIWTSAFIVASIGCRGGSVNDATRATSEKQQPTPTSARPAAGVEPPRPSPSDTGPRPPVPTYDNEETLDPITFAKRKAVSNGAHLSLVRLMTVLLDDRQICDHLPDGKVGPTPPLSVRCAGGPGGRCTKSATPSEPWEYDERLWEHEAWQFVEVKYFEGDAYHLSMEWRATDDPQEPCHYRVYAFGDLDDDGVFSTFVQGSDLAPELGEERPPNPTALE